MRNILSISSSALAVAISISSAAAQSSPQLDPPSDYQRDERGVDLTSGRFTYDPTAFSIGGEGGGLSYFRPAGVQGYRDEYDSSILGSSTYGLIVVKIGAIADQFGYDGGKSQSGSGATLSTDGYNYTYTTSNGTIYEFRREVYADVWIDGTYKGITPKVTRITKPNGQILTIDYTLRQYQQSGAQGNITRQASRPNAVTSNDGYRLNFWYSFNDNEDTLDYTTVDRWMVVASATGSNAAERFCTPNTCNPATPGLRSVRYNRSGSTETRVDAAGRETYLTLDAQGRVTTINAPGTDAVQITYDSEGRVSSYSQGSYTWNYQISQFNGDRTVKVTSPTGLETTAHSKIAVGKLLSLKVGSQGATTFQYDSINRLIAVISPEGNKTVYTYDANDNVTRLTVFGKSGEEINHLSATYPSDCGNVKTCHSPLTVTDEHGATTSIQYAPEHGQPTRITRPPAYAGGPQGEQTLTYQPLYAWYKDAGGNLTQAPSPIWKLVGTSECATAAQCVGSAQETRTAIGYGSPGQANNLLPVTNTVQAGDGSVAMTTNTSYTVFGEVQTSSVGTDDATVYRYNSAGELEGVLAPDPDLGGPRRRQAKRFGRDAAGRIQTTEVGTVAGVSDADWSAFASTQTATSTYNGRGLEISNVVTANGNVLGSALYSYDGDSRLVCQVTRAGGVSDACDQNGTCASNDTITRYTYNGAGDIASVNQDGVDAIRYSYTANGQVATQTDANNNITSYQYDSADRLLRTTYADGSYEYLNRNGIGDIDSVRQRDGRTITNIYDGLGRLVGQQLPGDVAGNSNPTFSYDLKDRLISASNGNGQPQWTNSSTFTYDALDRLTSEVVATAGVASRTTSYQYDASGRRNRLGWFDGFFVSYEYDHAGQLTVVRENGGFPLASFSYDDLGRRLGVVRGNGTSTGYGYDAVGRLASFSHDLAGSTRDLTTQLTRDNLGRITLLERSNDAYSWPGYVSSNRSYGRNALNQYTSAGSVSFGYDARGNLSSDSSTATYAFDSMNNLVASSGGAALAYDAQGRLTYTALNGGNVTRFGYDGEQIISEFDVNGGLVRRYVPGLADDEYLISYGPEGRRYFYADERGSIIATADDNGNPSATLSYDEFGIPASTNTLRFQYTGQAWLPEVGMYHYKARNYSPTLGRFVQADPDGYDDGMNVYDYVQGDPINRIDPTGRFACITDPASIVVCGKIVSNVVPIVASAAGGVFAVLGKIFGLFGNGPARVQYKPKDPPRQTQKSKPETQNAITCVGTVTFSAVGPLPQAPGDSAFAPGVKPPNGTVAIAGPKTFGFGRRALREGAAARIKIYPSGLDDILAKSGGPRPPYTVSDYGDKNIRNAAGTRFDIYRFATKAGANLFGKRKNVPVRIEVPGGGHCPAGTAVK